ncbi:MAG: hypothetical protein FJW36_09615 [Acidobacteria bacterium]|nr:hypothetical protein [Acidobacteriota bacterium]
MPKKYHSIASVLIFAIIGLGIGYLFGKLLKSSTGSLNIGLSIIPIAILVTWLILAFHELGHVIGGSLSGFRMHLFAVGPLRINRSGDRLEFAFNRTPSLWGGIAASLPSPEALADTETLRKQMLRVVAGGPIASLLGTLAALPAIWLWPRNQHLAAAFMIFAIGSFCIALATMLPIGNAGFVNDGSRLLQLLRRSPEGDRWVANALLGSMSLNLRPREWPAQLIEATTTDTQPSLDSILAM